MSIGVEAMQKLKSLAHEVSVREGCLLYDIEFGGGPQGRVLRVFIDKAEGSVSLDDCSNVSKGLNLVLDVEDLVPGGRYDLEVSSPGLERKLTQDWHFDKAKGQKVRVKLREPVASHGGKTAVKSIEGLIESCDEKLVYIRNQQQQWDVPRTLIEKAQVIFGDSPTPAKKGKKG